VDQVLHLADARDLPRRDLDALDVLLSLHDPAQEHEPVLCVDADVPRRHARATVELTLDLARERDVVERLTVVGAGGVERAPGDPDRVRLRPPSPPLTTGGLEQHLRPIRDAIHPRRYALKNRERTNRLLTLMQLHANGDDSEPAYRKAILDWLLANGGRPRGLRRAISEPLGAPSLR
jgi:hypothetical protein